jgi:hypothetical protein
VRLLNSARMPGITPTTETPADRPVTNVRRLSTFKAIDKIMPLLETGLMKNLIATALLCLAVFGCGKRALDLSGNWELTLPQGAKFRSPIERVSENTWRIPSIQSLSGVYELKSDKLVVKVPTDPRLTEFVWKVENANSLTLIEAPPASKIGSDYKGATLTRLP